MPAYRPNALMVPLPKQELVFDPFQPYTGTISYCAKDRPFDIPGVDILPSNIFLWYGQISSNSGKGVGAVQNSILQQVPKLGNHRSRKLRDPLKHSMRKEISVFQCRWLDRLLKKSQIQKHFDRPALDDLDLGGRLFPSFFPLLFPTVTVKLSFCGLSTI